MGAEHSRLPVVPIFIIRLTNGEAYRLAAWARHPSRGVIKKGQNDFVIGIFVTTQQPNEFVVERSDRHVRWWFANYSFGIEVFWKSYGHRSYSYYQRLVINKKVTAEGSLRSPQPSPEGRFIKIVY